MKIIAPLALIALLPLAACGGASPPPAQDADSVAAANPAPLICPSPAVLQQAQSLTQFLPGRQDVAARITTAQIIKPDGQPGISGTCVLHRAAGTVFVTLHTSFVADNGPANHGGVLTLRWFAAIANGDTIITKSNYTETLKFEGNASVATGTAKPVKIELPDTALTANIEILVGFQETPDQLAYAAAHPQAAP